MVYIKKSDNFSDCTMSDKDYKELTLQMSTGDFHAHEAVKLSERAYRLLDIEFEKPHMVLDKATGEWVCINDDLIKK